MKGTGTWHDDTLKALGTIENSALDSSLKLLSPKTPPSLQVRRDAGPVAN